LNDVEAPAWLQTLDSSKPAIFVTQGTLANFDFDQLVNPALEALENDDVQVIVTAGGGNRNAIRAAAHTMVETYLPYEFVLPKTSVFITNGGYNGVQHALSYGVPVMSAGISEDKRQVAARINWSGAGIGLLTASPTAAQIYEAVSDILRDPRYRNRARALGESLKKTDALTTIASFVDKTLNEGSGNGNDRYQRLLKK
jgi:UDP:flavonoid glycosyltransferase YjiC (YdhE family)